MDGMFVSPCCQCGTKMWLPIDLFAAAKHSEKIIFYCAYGHAQIFPQGDSQTEILRRERDRLAQKLAEKDDHILALTKNHTALQVKHKAQTRKLKRVDHGICPECNRSFENLQRHMNTKHMGYSARDVH